MKITEKEIRNIVRSELELNEGFWNPKDSPVLQGLGIVKPRTEEEKKQAEIDNLKQLLPPATQDIIDAKTAARDSLPTNPIEFFTYHQLDVEEFIYDLVLNDIEPKTKILDDGTNIVYYDGSGTHDFLPDEIQILRKDYIDKSVKVFFKKYDLDEDGDYGDMGDIEIALSDELNKQTGVDIRGIPGTSNVEWMMKPISSNRKNKKTLENIRTKVCKIISEYIKDKFKDMSPKSGEYFLTDNNDLGWRKQFAICVPRDIESILDGSSNFLEWAANDPHEWEKILANDMNIPIGDIIKNKAQKEFAVIGCIVTIIYDLDLPIDELEDPNLSSAAITQRNMDKIKSELERQEAMIDYEAQEKYQEPDIELETFSKRNMFDFTKQHPYLWKDFKSLMIADRDDIMGTNEEINKLLISNSLKMYKELDLPAQLNSFFDQEKSEKEEAAKAAKAAKAARIAAQPEEARQRNIRNQQLGSNTVLLDDILGYKKYASEVLDLFFKGMKTFKPVFVGILDNTSDPRSAVYKSALKGIRTKLRRQKELGELESLEPSDSGYSQLSGLSKPLFEDLQSELKKWKSHIHLERYIHRKSDPNHQVDIRYPLNLITDYDLNKDVDINKIHYLLLDLIR